MTFNVPDNFCTATCNRVFLKTWDRWRSIWSKEVIYSGTMILGVKDGEDDRFKNISFFDILIYFV